jgi:hypothetical protein
MNPFAFIISVVVIAFLFPLFRHMIEDCYVTGLNARTWPDRVFQWFLGGMLCIVFVAIMFGVLAAGTLPSNGRFAL